MNCIICEGNEELNCVLCKVCGMHTDRPVIYNNLFFCSEKCVDFFKNICDKSPELAERKIIF